MADGRWPPCAFLCSVALILACFAPAHGQGAGREPATYVVGDEGTWWTSPAASNLAATYYQDWADKQTVYVNDSLYFSYNNSLYDVTFVYTEKELSACDPSNFSAYDGTGQSYFTFYDSSTFYVMSSGGATGASADCQAGMKFQVQVLPLDSEAPPPAAVPPPTSASPPPGSSPPARGSPPPSSTSGSPPPPPSKQSPPPPSSSTGVPPAGGLVLQIEIPWEPQANDSSFYQNYLSDQLQKNGLTFVPVGSSLVFNYVSGKNNVLRVNATDFDTCTKPDKPISQNKDPDIPIKLPDEGQYYFIDGMKDHCSAGNMKLFVQVGSGQGPSPSPTGSGSGSAGSSSGTKFPIVAVVAPSVLIVAGLLLLICCCRCYHSKATGKYITVNTNLSYVPPGMVNTAQNTEKLTNILAGNNGRSICKIFTFQELERATAKFSANNEIGSGGFGTVYKGTLDDGTQVAIKRTKHAGGNDVEQFINEMSILSQVNNRNLVKLLGCCVVLEVPLLVYEFVSNGTLEEHLSMANQGFASKLDWASRFKIAIQTAEALKYLHVQATPPIFHRDVKTANILLDDNFNAKVGDFGLSKLVDVKATHVSTIVKGTPGYLDPEYFHNFQLTDKTDVYSFGVVLLELITSKRPIDLSKSAGEQNLAVCSIPLIRTGRVEEIIDKQMCSEITEEDFREIEGVAQVAVACLIPERASRPTMSDVVEMLQRIKGSKLRAEEFCNRAEANERTHSPLDIPSYALTDGFSYHSKTSASSSSSSSAISINSSGNMRPR